MKRFLISSAAVLGVATTAMAADLPEPMEQVAPEVYGPTVFNWSGPYIGAAVGGAFGNSNARVSGLGSRDIDMNGVIGGLYAGYNYQFTPNFLAGAEGDFQFSSAEGDKRLGGLRIKTRDQWLASIRARAGVTFDRFLVYGTGGVAFAGFETEARGSSSETKNKVGWTVGAGVEYAITDNLIGRLDYQYAAFGRDTNRLGGRRIETDYDTSAVKVGLSYKF